MGFDALTYGAAVQAGKTYTDATAVTTAATAASALAATLDYTAVNGSGAGSDTYACDIGSAKIKRFSLTIADTDAKFVTFSNVPTGRCEVELEITTSAEASVTWTLNSGTINWQGRSAPILPDGMIHRIKFLTSDSGTTWQAYVSAGIMT
jgi:hypothetical protein